MNTIYNKLNFPNIYALRSSAGSGKTFSIACWYLRLLLHPDLSPYNNDLYKNILAITFTNKASKEMKERILSFMKKIALNDMDSIKNIRIFQELSNIGDKGKAEKVSNIIDSIFYNYEHFNIKTIDSFISFLIKSIALNIGINPKFEIEDEKDTFIKKALRDYISYIIQNEMKEEKDLISNIILDQFFYEMDNYFPENTIIKTIKSFLYTEGIYARKFFSLPYDNKKLGIIFNEIAEKVKLFIISFQASRLEPVKLFQNLLENLSSLSYQTNYNAFKKIINSKYIRNNMEGFFKNKPFINDEIQSIWQSILDLIKKAVEYKAETFYYNHIRLYHQVKKFIDEHKKASNILFIDDLNILLKNFIDDQNNLIVLESNFDHFLIDEFQDTNLLQIENLEFLISEALSEKGSLFLVGDKKQSIYRFRGSDSRIFDKVHNKFHLTVNYGYLDTNYRSLLNIVNFNNELFSKKNIQKWCISIFNNAFNNLDHNAIQDRIKPIISDYDDSKQLSSKKDYIEKGYIQLSLINKEEDYSHLIDLIKNDLMKRYDSKDIAVLTFKNQESKDISEFFASHQIPSISDNSLDIRDNYIIKPVISLINFIINQNLENCLFEFLYSRVFIEWISAYRDNISGRILLKQLEMRNKTIPLFDFINELYPELKTILFPSLSSHLRSKSFYAFTRAISRILRLLENFPDEAIYIYKLFEFIHSCSDRADYTTEKIMDILNSKEQNKELEIEASNDLDSVKILTIHKAKGLQFPIVIIPSIKLNYHKISRVNDITAIKDNKINLYKIRKDEIVYSDLISELYTEEFRQNISDSLNMLYVAFTRPSDELYVYFTEKLDKKNNYLSLLDFNPDILRSLEENSRYTIGNKTKKKRSDKDTLMHKIKISKEKNWEKFLEKEIKNSDRPSHLIDLALQNAVFTSLITAGTKNEIFSQFEYICSLHQIQETKVHEGSQRLYKIIDNEILKEFYNNKKLRSNFVLIDKGSNKVIIDKLIFDDEKEIILTLKYFLQIKEKESYKISIRGLKDIYPDRKIINYIFSIKENILEEFIL